MMAHAKLSPSASKRWINCPGSVRLSEGIPERSSTFAEEGSAAHMLAEKCFLGKFVPADMLGGFINAKDDVVHAPGADENHKPGLRYYEVTAEMVDAIETYLGVLNAAIQPGDEYDVEQKVYLTETIYGTADFVRYRPSTGELLVADFKYGQGVAVEVKDNTQAIIYALGALKAKSNRGVSLIEVVIVQPRCPHKDGRVRTWSVEPIDLLEWEADVLAAAERTRASDAAFKTGDWCKFCPAAATCDTLRDKSLAEAKAEFGPGYDPEKLAHALSVVGAVEDWCKRVREFAHAEATDGRIPPGWKLVAGRATRRWKDEETAKTALAALYDIDPADMYDKPKLLSPAKMEAGLKRYGLAAKDAKAALADFTESVGNGTVLAPVGDPRPAARPDAAEEFA